MPYKLEIRAFRATEHKVKLLSFHPTKTWLAFADKGVGYGVIDWDTQQTILEGTTSQGEDQQSILQALQRQAEKDPDFYGSSGSETPLSKPAAGGAVKDILFLDLESCYWQFHRFSRPQTSSAPSKIIQSLGEAESLRKHSWLVLVCESRIRLHDLGSEATHDIPRAVLENKVPTCAAILYYNSSKLVAGGSEAKKQGSVAAPILAVGTSSGIIYLLSVTSNYCHAKLVGGHKTAVSHLQSIPGRNALNPEEGLVSAGSDGSLAVWYPSAQAEKLGLLASQELASTATAKAHEGEIHSMTVVQSQSPEAGTESAHLYLVSSGEDKRVVVTQLPDLSHQIARWKPLAKGAVDSLDLCPLAGPSKRELLAVSGDRAAICSFGYDGRASEASVLLNLDNYLPLGTKKAAKCYKLACHPLRPDIIAVGSNTGIALVTALSDHSTSAAVLPQSQSLQQQPGLPSPSNGLEYVCASDSGIWKLTYRAERDQTTAEAQLKAVRGSWARIAPSASTGPVDISVGSTGLHVGVVWLETKEFGVFTQHSAEVWNKSHQGTGACIAWAPSGTQYAVLHHPQVKLPEPRRVRTKKSKAREEENAHQAAVEAAKLAVQEGAYVVIYNISNSGVSSEVRRIETRGENPTRLFGGPLLSIVGNRTPKGSKKGLSMKMVAWVSGAAVGGELAAPSWVAWQPEVTAVALGYDSTVVIFRTQPEFTRIASLSIQETVSGHWNRGFLCVVSERECHGVFVEASATTPFVQAVRLASTDSGIASQVVAHSLPGSALSSEGVCCIGAVSIAGIHEGVLWLIDRFGTPFLVPLNDASLRAKFAASQGDPKTAALVAEQGVPKQQHDEIALFLAAINQGPGLEAALTLSGLRLRTELGLSRRAGKFRRALRCLQALAAGVNDASSFQEFPDWLKHQSESTPLEMIRAQGATLPPLSFQQLIQHTRGISMDGHKEPTPKQTSKRLSLLKFIAADNVEEESSEDEEVVEPAQTLVGLQTAPSEAIDWDAPLSVVVSQLEQEGEGEVGDDLKKTPSLTALSASGDVLQDSSATDRSKEGEASIEEQKRLVDLMQDGILLVDAALGYGHEDVAVATLRTLLRGAGSMRPEMLQAILTRCAQCSLREDLSGFAARIVSEGTGAAPEPAALAAALVDNPTLSHNVLQSSGLTALAAIYSHSWKTGNSLMEISHWGKHLTAASGNGVQFVVAPPNF